MTEEMTATISNFIARDILKQPNRAIKSDEPLLTSGLIDSFHLVDLALFVEDTFGVHLEDTELNSSSFDTVDQLAALIQGRK